MRKPVIAINLTPRDYDGHISLGRSVAANMNLNPWFSSPTPSVADLLVAVEEAKDARAQWGTPGNHGSTLDLSNLRIKTMRLGQLLKAMSQYVQMTAQLTAGSDYGFMTNIIMSSGFALKKDKSPQGRLQQVTYFQTVASRALNRNQVMLSWAKPLAVSSPCNVKMFKIYKGASDRLGEAKVVATTSRTNFKDTNTSSEMVMWFYWVVPCGAAGDGVPHGPLPVKLVSA